jgi:hypothetical protein
VVCERDGTDVPRVVSEMIKYLVETALNEEGLFRVTGFKSEMLALRNKAEVCACVCAMFVSYRTRTGW